MDDTPDHSAHRPVDAAKIGRLDSWKEIAGYLGKGVTTAQRWEQEDGVPVHRLPHVRKGSVFAFTSELDAWRTGRAEHAAKVKIEGTCPSPGLDRSSKEVFAAGPSDSRIPLLFLAAGVTALTLGWMAWTSPIGFASVHRTRRERLQRRSSLDRRP